MASWLDYMQQTQRFIHDSSQSLVDPYDIQNYINRARREIAQRSQCIRRLTPISGSIISGNVVSAGSGYTNPVLVISPPDFPSGSQPFPNGLQAVGALSQIGGHIDSVNIAVGGYGYFQPLMTVADPTGVGAAISANLSPMNLLAQGQEVYPFSAVDLSNWPGVDSIFAVHSVSVIYSNYRYTLPMYSFSVYQAKVRQYPFQYEYVPSICSQYGQGQDGSIYVYPLPSQVYQMEWDCFCLPSDLSGDTDYEAIPKPWSDAVPHFAAYFAFLELQNMNSARLHLELFEKFTKQYSGYARPGRVTNPYGRW